MEKKKELNRKRNRRKNMERIERRATTKKLVSSYLRKTHKKTESEASIEGMNSLKR